MATGDKSIHAWHDSLYFKIREDHWVWWPSVESTLSARRPLERMSRNMKACFNLVKWSARCTSVAIQRKISINLSGSSSNSPAVSFRPPTSIAKHFSWVEGRGPSFTSKSYKLRQSVTAITGKRSASSRPQGMPVWKADVVAVDRLDQRKPCIPPGIWILLQPPSCCRSRPRSSRSWSQWAWRSRTIPLNFWPLSGAYSTAQGEKGVEL